MNKDEIHERLREEYSSLIERHEELKKLRKNDHSLKSDAELSSEMDGVIMGISAIEDVLNEIEADATESEVKQ